MPGPVNVIVVFCNAGVPNENVVGPDLREYAQLTTVAPPLVTAFPLKETEFTGSCMVCVDGVMVTAGGVLLFTIICTVSVMVAVLLSVILNSYVYVPVD